MFYLQYSVILLGGKNEKKGRKKVFEESGARDTLTLRDPEGALEI